MKVKNAILLAVVSLLVLAGPCVFASEAAHGAEESVWNTWMLTWRVINAAVLVGLLYWLLQPRIVTFFAERQSQIQKDLEEAKEQRAEAERQIAEYREKIAGMAQELDKMRAELQKTADTESKKVIANAERMATAVVESARIAADQEVRKARTALKNEAVELAMSMAEALIRERINEDDRKRLVEDYLVKVGGMK